MLLMWYRVGKYDKKRCIKSVFSVSNCRRAQEVGRVQGSAIDAQQVWRVRLFFAWSRGDRVEANSGMIIACQLSGAMNGPIRPFVCCDQ